MLDKSGLKSSKEAENAPNKRPIGTPHHSTATPNPENILDPATYDTRKNAQKLAPNPPSPDEPPPFIAAVGASAGGLEALTELFAFAQRNSRVAWVCIQHLDPTKKSEMRQLLARKTELNVVETEDGMAVEQGTLYLLPSGFELEINDYHLYLKPVQETKGRANRAVNHFFKSLAENAIGEMAGIILSGTGSDGTEGLQAITNAGGFAVVQRPDSAEFDGMPTSALRALSNAVPTAIPKKMAPALESLADVAWLAAKRAGRRQRLRTEKSSHEATGILTSLLIHQEADEQDLLTPEEAIAFGEIKDLISQLGNDFRNYKTPMLLRRIERRRTALRAEGTDTENLAAYCDHLKISPQSVQDLAADIPILTSQFFRDDEFISDVIEQLRPIVLEKIKTGERLRVWSCGCSTGQEPYTLAMILSNLYQESNLEPLFTIIATDISDYALSFAETATYKPDDAEHIPQPYLHQHVDVGKALTFTSRLKRNIRFIKHNVLTDAGFTNIDVVTCRNLLVYLDQQAQAQALKKFYFALIPEGRLFLGKAEDTRALESGFKTLEPPSFKVFQKQEDRPVDRPYPPAPPSVEGTEWPELPPGSQVHESLAAGLSHPTKTSIGLQKARTLYRDFAMEQLPRNLIFVDKDIRIAHMLGEASAYLEVSREVITDSLLQRLPQQERGKIAQLVISAMQAQKKTSLSGIDFRTTEANCYAQVSVTPNKESDKLPFSAVVEFTEQEERGAARSGDSADDDYLQFLEGRVSELLEEASVARTEHMHASEELVSFNEELQGNLEEVESIYEESQSTNAELENSIAQLKTTFADLNGVLQATQAAAIFLDGNLRLQGFSPLAAELFGFHEADTGRPFSAFTFPLKSTNIHKKAQESLASGVPFQTETADSEGRLYLTCMQPSLSPKRIAILFLRIQDKSFASAVAQKGVAELTSFKFLFESFLDTAPPIAWIQNADGSFRYVNQSFMAHFHLGSSDVQSENPMLFAAPGQEDCEGLNPKEPNRAMSGRIVTWVRPYGQEERLELSLFEVSDVHGAPCYCGIAQNVTERDTAVTTLKQTVAALDAANQRMQEMARIVSHDLRAPAKSMTDQLTNLKGMLATSLSPQAEHTINTLSAMAQGSYETLTDLHEVLYSGKMSEDRPKCLSVMDEVCAALDSLNLRSAEAQVELELQIPDKATLIFPPTPFRSVLYNLLSNAQKYRKAEGPLKITVSYEEIDSRAVLSVEDNGIGIDMEKHRDQIFRLYTRFHHAAPGKGIGLYATKDLLEQFGGALRLESALNKGSTFTVELPINKALLPLK